jgi:hypothetical protein
MRGFETTAQLDQLATGLRRQVNLKVVIFTTVKPPIMGVKEKTNNISDLQQVTKRAYFTCRMHGRAPFAPEPS